MRDNLQGDEITKLEEGRRLLAEEEERERLELRAAEMGKTKVSEVVIAIETLGDSSYQPPVPEPTPAVNPTIPIHTEYDPKHPVLGMTELTPSVTIGPTSVICLPPPPGGKFSLPRIPEDDVVTEFMD